MNSKAKKEEKKTKLGKKEKKKRLKDVDANNSIEDQEEIKKSGIFSALDQIDTKSKEVTRVIEEKLRAGLIKSEQTEKIETIKKKDIDINEIKAKVEKLRNLRNIYDENGEYDEAIEVSNQILTHAFSNNLKAIVNEEKEFLKIIKEKINQKSKTMEILENEEHSSPIEFTTPSIQATEKLDLNKGKAKPKFKKLKIQDKEKFDRESLKFIEEKEEFKQEKLKLEEEKEAFQWEKQMYEEVKKYERDKEKEESSENLKNEADRIGIDDIKKFKEEKEIFERKKAEFEEIKLKFKERREIFKQEKLKLKEEKETFQWEKEMFEEMKKHERSKEKNV